MCVCTHSTLWQSSLCCSHHFPSSYHRRPQVAFAHCRFVDLGHTKDARVITINTNDRVSSEVRILDSTQPMKAPQLLYPRVTGVQYFVEHNNVRR